MAPFFGGPVDAGPVEKNPSVTKAEPEATATPAIKAELRAPQGLSDYWPPAIRRMADIITEAAKVAHLDCDLIAAVIKKETWFNPNLYPQGLKACPDGPCSGSCTSYRGALGPMQVMPYHFGEGERGRDLRTNIETGSDILKDYIDRKGGVREGLAAYYCGPNRSHYSTDCWVYADSILEWYEESTGSSGKQGS